MTHYFLLSAASRTLSLRSIYKAGEDAAYKVFCEMRWPETDGEAVCPCCGFDETYQITTGRKFKCKAPSSSDPGVLSPYKLLISKGASGSQCFAKC